MDKLETNEYLHEVYYFSDAQKFEESLLGIPGAKLLAVLNVPSLNAWGQEVGTKFLIIYRATEELGIEVMT